MNKKTLILPLIAASSLFCAAQSQAVTLLFDFQTASVDPVTPASFVGLPNTTLTLDNTGTPVVNTVQFTNGQARAAYTVAAGTQINLTSFAGNPFTLEKSLTPGGNPGGGASGTGTATTGPFANQPLLSDYLFLSNQLNAPGVVTFTLNGLSAIADGSALQLTLFGIGNAPVQDSLFTVSYAGVLVGTQSTTFNSDPALSNPSAEFQFVTVAGQNSLTFTLAGNGVSEFAPINGFALTSVVPEPSTLALLGLGLGSLVLARRRSATV